MAGDFVLSAIIVGKVLSGFGRLMGKLFHLLSTGVQKAVAAAQKTGC